MLHKSYGEVQWLEFELLADIKGLTHAIFLKHGGVSEGPYGTLNVAYGYDDPSHVQQNLDKVREVLGVPLLRGNQVHGTEIAVVSSLERESIGDCDGLITDKPHLGLMIQHADCQSAIFYDPLKRALANIHCGWRGNVQNIYKKTVEKMRHLYGSDPKNILVGISPSLGPNSAEFINYRNELPEIFWSFQIKPNYFDLWAISRHQLEESGILPGHIQIASLCTYDRKEDFFSYRREKKTGRHATVAALR